MFINSRYYMKDGEQWMLSDCRDCPHMDMDCYIASKNVYCRKMKRLLTSADGIPPACPLDKVICYTSGGKS